MNFIAVAWNKVKPETVSKCFQKAGFLPEKEVETMADVHEQITPSSIIDADDWVRLKGSTNVTVDDYISADSDVVTSQMKSLEEIIEDCSAGSAQDQPADSDIDSDDDPTPPPQNSVKL